MISSNPSYTGVASYQDMGSSPAESYEGSDECADETAHEAEITELAEWAEITTQQAWDFWYCFGDLGFAYELIDEVAEDLAAFANEDWRMVA